MVRYFRVLAAILPVIGIGHASSGNQEVDDARQRFSLMEEKLRKAGSISAKVAINIEVEIDGKIELQARAITGLLLRGGEDRVNFALDGTMLGKKLEVKAVSNGKKVLTVMNPGLEPLQQDTPNGLGELLSSLLARGGISMWGFLIGYIRGRDKAGANDERGALDVSAALPVSGFKFLPEERAADQLLEGVHFKLALQSSKWDWSVSLWISKRTGLPVKRVVVGTLGDRKTIFTETYEMVDLETKIDPAKFKLSED